MGSVPVALSLKPNFSWNPWHSRALTLLSYGPLRREKGSFSSVKKHTDRVSVQDPQNDPRSLQARTCESPTFQAPSPRIRPAPRCKARGSLILRGRKAK